jgi:hypothetical protein
MYASKPSRKQRVAEDGACMAFDLAGLLRAVVNRDCNYVSPWFQRV